MDQSGNGNNGIATSIKFVPDRFAVNDGSALFNGLDSVVSIPNSATVDLHGNVGLTLSAWINSTDASRDQAIVGKWGLGGDEDDQFWLALQNGRVRFLTDEEVTEIYSQTMPHSNEDYHVVGVYDPAVRQIEIFINGRLDAAKPLLHNIRSTTQEVLIGNAAFASLPFIGTIDDVRIYNRALAAEEVRALYSLQKNPNPWLAIEKRNAIQMFLKPGKTYQIESSSDLVKWSDYGRSIVAEREIESAAAIAEERNRFFRLRQEF
jgi:hypothetical protein